jgi:hypothetical protein
MLNAREMIKNATFTSWQLLVGFLFCFIPLFGNVAFSQTFGPTQVIKIPSGCVQPFDPDFKVTLVIASNQITVDAVSLRLRYGYSMVRGTLGAYLNLSDFAAKTPPLGSVSVGAPGTLGQLSQSVKFNLSPLSSYYGKRLYFVFYRPDSYGGYTSYQINTLANTATSIENWIEGGNVCPTYAQFDIPPAPSSPTTINLDVRDINNNALSQADIGTIVSLTAAPTPVGVGGKVTFYSGTSPIASNIAINSSGLALWPYVLSTPGLNSFSAQFVPDTTAYTSSGSNAVNIGVYQPTQTSIKLASTAQTGKPITITATISSGGYVPGAYAVKVDGTTVNQSVFLAASGITAIGLAPLTAGNHTIVVDFVPESGTYSKPSSSPPLSINVQNAGAIPAILQLLLND